MLILAMRALIVIGFMLAPAAWAQTLAAAPPTVMVDSITPVGAEKQILRVALAVRISNANSFPLELQTLDVLLNGKTAQPDPVLARVRIPPAGELKMNIHRLVTMDQVASALLPLGPREVQYDVSGVALAAGGEEVPFAGRGTSRWAVSE